MRRSGLRALLNSRRSLSGTSLRCGSFSKRETKELLWYYELKYRSLHTGQCRINQSPKFNTMSPRSFSVALVSGFIASGVYYFAFRNGPGLAIRLDSIGNGIGHVNGDDKQRALVIDQNYFYSVPATNDLLSKETDDSGRRVVEMLSSEQVTRKLRKNEESWLIGRDQGVFRYDLVQLASNDPIEDDHSELIVKATTGEEGRDTEASDWMFWGVFDGHSGWTTSARLRQSLISFVAHELNVTHKQAKNQGDNVPTGESIDEAIKRAFVRLDNEIVYKAVEKAVKVGTKAAATELLAPALSGSCALLTFFDSRTKMLRVACTGDSRAVLGRRNKQGGWTAIPLSVDQTGGTPEEAERLRREHEGEPYVVTSGRVLGGLEPTRAFGDATYKWNAETHDTVMQKFFGRNRSKLIKTPPYVTAEPVVTKMQIEPENGDFLIMATDGLWEMLTNEEAVGLVGQWLIEQQVTKDGRGSNLNLGKWWDGLRKNGPEVVSESEGKDTEKRGQRAPIRQEQWGEGSERGKWSLRFLVEDKNVATHLVRNALGGRRRDQVSALLSLPSPHCRRYRDDLTVQVIFFGNRSDEEVGKSVDKIVRNMEYRNDEWATTRDQGKARAKL